MGKPKQTAVARIKARVLEPARQESSNPETQGFQGEGQMKLSRLFEEENSVVKTAKEDDAARKKAENEQAKALSTARKHSDERRKRHEKALADARESNCA